MLSWSLLKSGADVLLEVGVVGQLDDDVEVDARRLVEVPEEDGEHLVRRAQVDGDVLHPGAQLDEAALGPLLVAVGDLLDLADHRLHVAARDLLALGDVRDAGGGQEGIPRPAEGLLQVGDGEVLRRALEHRLRELDGDRHQLRAGAGRGLGGRLGLERAGEEAEGEEAAIPRAARRREEGPRVIRVGPLLPIMRPIIPFLSPPDESRLIQAVEAPRWTRAGAVSPLPPAPGRARPPGRGTSGTGRRSPPRAGS